MKKFTRFILMCAIMIWQHALSQDSVWSQIPDRYFDLISKKAGDLDKRLSNRSARAIDQLKKDKKKLKRKLTKIDSSTAQGVYNRLVEKYKDLELVLQQTDINRRYIPYLDTLITGFNFLGQNQNAGVIQAEKLKDALSNVKGLENQLHGIFSSSKNINDVRTYYIWHTEQKTIISLADFSDLYQSELILVELFPANEEISLIYSVTKNPKLEY